MGRSAGLASGIVTGALAGAAIAMLVTPLGPPGSREALRALASTASRRTAT